jgi:predicted DNA-binding protein with PD1-like motif
MRAGFGRGKSSTVIVYESDKVRRILLRPERGDELVRALAEAADERRVGCARISGWGVFEDVTLERTSADAPLEEVVVEGPALATSIVGTIGREVDATVAQIFVTLQAPDGLVSGRAVSAVVVVGELFLDAFDDADPVRVRDRVTGLVTFRASRAAPNLQTDDDALRADSGSPSAMDTGVAEAPPASALGAWAAVAAASADAAQGEAPSSARAPAKNRAERRGRRGRERSSRRIAEESRDAKVPAHRPKPLPQRRRALDEAFFEDPIPERGSYLDHPQLGRCFVIDEDGNGDIVIRLPSGGHRTLKLELMRVEGPEQDEDDLVYQVRPKGRRIS